MAQQEVVQIDRVPIRTKLNSAADQIESALAIALTDDTLELYDPEIRKYYTKIVLGLRNTITSIGGGSAGHVIKAAIKVTAKTLETLHQALDDAPLHLSTESWAAITSTEAGGEFLTSIGVAIADIQGVQDMLPPTDPVLQDHRKKYVWINQNIVKAVGPIISSIYQQQ